MHSLKQTKHETQKQHSSRYADVTMIRHFSPEYSEHSWLSSRHSRSEGTLNTSSDDDDIWNYSQHHHTNNLQINSWLTLNTLIYTQTNDICYTAYKGRQCSAKIGTVAPTAAQSWAPTGMGKRGQLPTHGKVEKCYRVKKTPSPKSGWTASP